MYMRLTPREKEMADMFEQMSREKQEIMIELAKRMQTEEPEKLLKEIKQRLHIDDPIHGWTHSKAVLNRKTLCPDSSAPLMNSSASNAEVPFLWGLPVIITIYILFLHSGKLFR